MSEIISVILLAGGKGERMKTSTPKQFLHLNDKPIVCYSYEVFLSLPEVSEIVVVCDQKYRALFPCPKDKRLAFAEPGPERQDSVYHGLQALDENSHYVCVHDGARPFIDIELIRLLLSAAKKHGAAVPAVRVKATIKECAEDLFVKVTHERRLLWEIQTPQVMRSLLLKEGFINAHERGFQVTDEASLIEKLPHPVKIVESSYKNVKITTAEDLILANAFLQSSHSVPSHG